MTILLKRSILEQLEVGDNKIDGFDINSGKKIVKKLRKLFKSQKPAKSKKNLSKSENLPNFGAIEVGLKFLTPNARTAFNYLWLAFIKTLIL